MMHWYLPLTFPILNISINQVICFIIEQVIALLHEHGLTEYRNRLCRLARWCICYGWVDPTSSREGVLHVIINFQAAAHTMNTEQNLAGKRIAIVTMINCIQSTNWQNNIHLIKTFLLYFQSVILIYCTHIHKNSILKIARHTQQPYSPN